MPQLDALRGLAILAVLVEHWSGPAISHKIPIGAGTVGVSLFFVLSGFLITGSLLKSMRTQPATGTLVSFYVRRFFRLFPAYYLVLAALALLAIRGIQDTWPWHAAYLSNVYVALGGKSNVFWTLSVEEQFYLFWPLLLISLTAKRAFAGALGLIAIDILLRIIFVSVGILPEFRLTCFELVPLGAGCALSAFLARDGGYHFAQIKPDHERWFAIVAMLMMISAIFLWFWGGREGGKARFLLNDPLTIPFYTFAVFKAAKGMTGFAANIMNNHALRYIGIISYGIYLVHSFVPTIVANAGVVYRPAAALLSIIITFGVCSLSWALYEKPMIRLGRKLSERLSSPDLRAPR